MSYTWDHVGESEAWGLSLCGEHGLLAGPWETWSDGIKGRASGTEPPQPSSAVQLLWSNVKLVSLIAVIHLVLRP